MFQINEVMTLVFGIVGFAVLFIFLKRGHIPRYTLLIIAYCLILASNICTVAEGFVFFNVFNMLEHIMYLASGVCVFVAIIKYIK